MSRSSNNVQGSPIGRSLRGQERFTVAFDDRLLWMILVPVADNKGLVFLDQHHKKFLDRVLETSGGSTGHSWGTGQWIDDGCFYRDRMIPLVFLGTYGEADQLAAFACIHYDQVKIQCFPISDRVCRYRRALKEGREPRRVQVQTSGKQLQSSRDDNPLASFSHGDGGAE